MDPSYGEKWAGYASGSATTELTFAYLVVEPDISAEDIAALINTLKSNGGTIESAATQAEADLAHDGLGNDPEHKVDSAVGTPGGQR